MNSTYLNLLYADLKLIDLNWNADDKNETARVLFLAIIRAYRICDSEIFNAFNFVRNTIDKMIMEAISECIPPASDENYSLDEIDKLYFPQYPNTVIYMLRNLGKRFVQIKQEQELIPHKELLSQIIRFVDNYIFWQKINSKAKEQIKTDDAATLLKRIDERLEVIEKRLEILEDFKDKMMMATEATIKNLKAGIFS